MPSIVIKPVKDSALLPGFRRSAAEISHGFGRKERLWFDVPEAGKSDESHLGNVWLLALLPLAFQTGKSLKICAPVDAVLLRNAVAVMRVWAQWFPPLQPVAIVAGPPAAPTTFGALLVNCWLVTPGLCLLRRSFLERTDGFRQALAPSDDWELWLRLTRLGELAFVDRVLLDYRRHCLSVSADDRRMREARTRIFDHLRRDPTLTPAERRLVGNVYSATQRHHAARFRRAAREKFRAGDWRGALRQLGYAVDYSFRAVRGRRRGRD